MTLLEKSVFLAGIKLKILRRYHPGSPWWVLGSNDNCPHYRPKRNTDTEKKGMWPQRQRLERCGHKPRNTRSPQNWKRQGRILPQGPQGPADSLILNSWPPELRKNKCLPFQDAEFVVTCCSRPVTREGPGCPPHPAQTSARPLLRHGCGPGCPVFSTQLFPLLTRTTLHQRIPRKHW